MILPQNLRQNDIQARILHPAKVIEHKYSIDILRHTIKNLSCSLLFSESYCLICSTYQKGVNLNEKVMIQEIKFYRDKWDT